MNIPNPKIYRLLPLMLRLFLVGAVALIAFLPCEAASSGIQTLKGKGIYHAAPNESLAEARAKAREAAIYNAIQERFGTVMTQSVIQDNSVDEAGEVTRFYSNSAYELKGEWVADVSTTYVDDFRHGALVVECECEFKGRQVTNQAPPIECATLSAPDKRSPSTKFDAGSHLYASFSSPSADGWLTVCLIDENGVVSRLLPSRSSDTDTFKVTKGYDYVFFDRDRLSEEGTRMLPVTLYVDGDKKMDINTIYFIFSPNLYADGPWKRPATRRGLYTMSVEEFNKWLQTMAARDPAMATKAVRVSIKAKPTNVEVIRN
ncbi:MAG: hypothetical protein K2O24_04105 [Muribaculaceae bacterium]|nr:hypothetical protein [Muribaculaceae bacterium]